MDYEQIHDTVRGTSARVIHISQAPADWKSNPRYVYIGHAGHGETGYFGNPFRLTRDTPEQRAVVLSDYSAWFQRRWATDVAFRTAIAKMRRDAILVCFCAPKACHGDLIAEVINHIHADDDVPIDVLMAEQGI